jgi:hypothetical protein
MSHCRNCPMPLNTPKMAKKPCKTAVLGCFASKN